MLFFGYHQWSTKPVEVMEFQLSDFKSWKMMLLKCCRQYASKSGKLSSASRTGNGQFSFQFLRTVPKNAQTTVQVGSFPTVPRLCSKSFKLSFSSTWTENFEMYKLNLERAEEQEIKLSTFPGSQKKQENFRNTSTSASLTTLKPLCGSWQTVEYSSRDGNTRPTYLPPEKSVCRLRSNS